MPLQRSGRSNRKHEAFLQQRAFPPRPRRPGPAGAGVPPGPMRRPAAARPRGLCGRLASLVPLLRGPRTLSPASAAPTSSSSETRIPPRDSHRGPSLQLCQAGFVPRRVPSCTLLLKGHGVRAQNDREGRPGFLPGLRDWPTSLYVTRGHAEPSDPCPPSPAPFKHPKDGSPTGSRPTMTAFLRRTPVRTRLFRHKPQTGPL